MRTLYFLPCGFYLLSFFFFSSPNLQRSEIGCLPYFRRWCGLSANLGCRSEMCCTRLAGNTGCKNDAKKSPSSHHRTNCRAESSQLQACIDNRKKLLSSNISSTCPHNMVNFGILAAEIISLVWGTPGNFNGFRVLASLLQRRRSSEDNHTLHDVWPSPELLHYIYIFGALAP